MNLAEKLAYARQFAKRAHGDQRYDSKRLYICHLDEVRNVALEFEVTDEDILVATLLHDVVEDTSTQVDCLKDKFGERVASLVDAVSKIKGVSRAKQRDQYHAKILSVDGAVTLKLCDRIANVRNCWLAVKKRHSDGTNSSLLGMYSNEYGAFRKALKSANCSKSEQAMWDELDFLLTWVKE